MRDPVVGLPIQVFTKDAHPGYGADTAHGPFAAVVTFLYAHEIENEPTIAAKVFPKVGMPFDLTHIPYEGTAPTLPARDFWRNLSDGLYAVAPVVDEPAPPPVTNPPDPPARAPAAGEPEVSGASGTTLTIQPGNESPPNTPAPPEGETKPLPTGEGAPLPPPTAATGENAQSLA